MNEQRPSKELCDRLRFTWADNGSGYNSDFTKDLNVAADEIERLQAAMRGIQSCSTCEACRGAATLALDGAPTPPKACNHPVLTDDPEQPGVNIYLCAVCKNVVRVNEFESFVREPDPPAASQIAPIARLYVAEDDTVTASMYAPGLPPGNHDVYPEPPADDYFDKYTTEHLEVASHFVTKLMCDYADRGSEEKAALLGTAVDVLSRLAMQRAVPTKSCPPCQLEAGGERCKDCGYNCIHGSNARTPCPVCHPTPQWTPQCTMCNDTGRFWTAVDGVGVACDHIRRVPDAAPACPTAGETSERARVLDAAAATGNVDHYTATVQAMIDRDSESDSGSAPRVIKEPCPTCKGVGRIGIPGSACHHCSGDGVWRRTVSEEASR